MTLRTKWHGQVSSQLVPNATPSHTIPLPNSSYTDRQTALANNLTFVTDDGKVIMKGDGATWLASGVYRNRFVPETLHDVLKAHVERSQCSYIQQDPIQHW